MAHPLCDKAAVSGIGETAYTRGTPKSGLALQLEASLAAIADAGLDPRDIDGVVPYFPPAWPPSRPRRWPSPPASATMC